MCFISFRTFTQSPVCILLLRNTPQALFILTYFYHSNNVRRRTEIAKLLIVPFSGALFFLPSPNIRTSSSNSLFPNTFGLCFSPIVRLQALRSYYNQYFVRTYVEINYFHETVVLVCNQSINFYNVIEPLEDLIYFANLTMCSQQFQHLESLQTCLQHYTLRVTHNTQHTKGSVRNMHR